MFRLSFLLSTFVLQSVDDELVAASLLALVISSDTGVASSPPSLSKSIVDWMMDSSWKLMKFASAMFMSLRVASLPSFEGVRVGRTRPMSCSSR